VLLHVYVQALADVHRRGYIHRDVKTENFCLDASGSNTDIKVIDFGFARLAYGEHPL
jgi:serine/threonine protein kinase